MKRILLLFGMLSCWISNAQLVAPVTETFNGTAVPAGWNLSATSGGPWLFQNNANSANCPVPSDHTGTAGNYAWMDQSGADATVIMEMDTVDISALTVPYLEFYYWMCGTGYSPPNTTEVQAWDGAAWQRVTLLSAATEGWEKQGMDLTTFIYNTDRVLIRFIAESGGHTSDFFGDNSLDDISVLDAPPCPRPANLGTANVVTTSADLTWRGATGNLTYDVIWGATGFDPNMQGTTVSATASPFALTSLTGNTAYDYYLVADCGTTNGQADTLGPISFRTACVAEAIGYFNGFEADVVNSTPLCWTGFQTRVNSNTNVVTISGPYAGVNHANLSSSSAVVNTDTIMLMSPQLLGLTSGNNQVRFFSQADNTGNTMIVGTVSNPSNPGSFTAIDTVRYSATFTYEEIIIPISVANGYNGTDEYVAFKHGNTQTFTEVYIDDFNYEVIPPCPKITAASVTGVTGTTVTLGFSTSGTSTGYEWGPVGFAQGTGTTGASSGNPITITGLAASTSYDIYIRNDCSGSGNGTSIWTGPITFTTLCAVLPAPYVQDFESSTIGHWDGIEQCWAYTGNNPGTSASGGYSWEVRNTSQVTSGTGTGPDRDNTLAPAVGGKFITADVSGSLTGGPDSTMVTSPLIDVVGLTVPQLSFYYHKHGTNQPDLNVDVWDGVWHRNAMVITGRTHNSQSEPYLKGSLDLSAYNDTVLVRFRILTGGCCQGDIGLDDVRIGEAPTCDIPTLLNLVSRTSTSGVINWVAGGSQVATNIEYGPSGFTPGTGMTIVSSDTIDTIPGLSSNTSYDVYLMDSCGVNGNSIQVGPITFTTKCTITPTTLPWNDGFESYSVGPYQGETDFCNPTYTWEFGPTVSQGRLRVAAGAGFANTGTQAATLDNATFTSPSTTNFLTLNVDLSNYTASTGIELSFSVLEIAQEDNADNRVWVRGSANDPWIEIVNLDSETTPGSFVDVDNVDIVGPLANAGQTVGTGTQIRFGQNGLSNAFNTNFSDGFSFDDVSLAEVTCPTPSTVGLTIGGVSDTSGTLSWDPSTFASDYQVWFGPAGFAQGSTTVGGVQVFTGGTASLLVDTMSPNSCYEYLVRYVCGAGDSSLWAGPYTFCTPCSPFFAPYFENYATSIVNSAPDCWTSLLEGGGAPFAGVTVINFNTLSVPNAMEIDNNAGGNTVIAYSPLFGDMNVGDKRVNFFARQSFGTGATLIIGTSDNPNSSLTFNPLDTITLTATYAEFVVDLTTIGGYNGTDQFVGLRHGQSGNFQPILVDDFIYEVIPTCPKPPTASIRVQSVGSTNAELEWDAGTPGNMNFEISYGVSITAPGQGVSMVVSGDSALLSSLMANTQYCYYVREICGPGDTSIWSLNPTCFSTLCLPFTAPYFQDFEGATSTVGHWDGLADCWDYSSNNPGTTSSGGYSWEIRNTVQTTSGGTGPDRDNTLAPAIGGKFITADVSGSTTNANGNDSTILSSPVIDISGLLAPEFEYHYHMFGTQMADLHVDIWNGSTWDRDIHVITGTQNTGVADPYNDTIFDLAPYAGQTDLRVRFRGVTNGCCAGDIAIDDIRISDPVSCSKPANLAVSNITASGARFDWDSGSLTPTNGDYEVSYGVNISMPSAGIASVQSGDSLILTGLTDATIYCYYVREICGPGDTSAWTGPSCFQTLCLTQSLPYGEDFNLSEGCMTLINVGTTPVGWEPQPAGGANQFGDLDGTGYMIADSDAHANGIHMISDMETPIIDASALTPGLALMLEFDHFFNAITNGSSDSGFVSVFDGTNWNTVYSTNTDVGAFGNPDFQSIDITAYANANLQVRWRFDDDNTWAWYWAVDNVLISEVSQACPVPTALASGQIDCNQIEMLWTSNSGSSIIQYGSAGFTPGTGTYSNIVTSPFFVTGLAPLTSYDFWIADTCGNDTSAWAGPFNVSTIACPAGCLDPTGLAATNITCTSADLSWTSGGTTIASAIEWGAAGFVPGGGGTVVGNAANPTNITGLTPGAMYEFYVVDFCATDTSNVVGPFAFTAASGPITALFTPTLDPATLTNRVLQVDASASVGATSYTWDWGDASPQSTVSSAQTFHSYAANGGYNVTLYITGDCGIDSITTLVTIDGISLTENALGRSLVLYPNPTAGQINLSFETSSSNAAISIMDLSGKLVKMIQVSDINGKYADQLDIAELSRGSYILKVESADLSVQRRIVKK